MDPKEIDRRLEEMWKKVSARSYAPDAPSLPSDIGSANLDTLKLLKDNFSKAEGEWRRLLEMKEGNLRDLSCQLEETKAHLGEIKQHYELSREKLINEELSTALNLEESKKTLAVQKKNHAGEITLLKEILERTKTEIVSLGARLDVVRRERDDWQKKFSALSVSEADFRDKAAGLENSLGDAKEAVERAMRELFSERKSRQDAEDKIKALEKNTKELSAELEAAKTNRDAERTQWRELWDRERPVWETQHALKGVRLPWTFISSSVCASAASKKAFTRVTAAALVSVLIMASGAWWLYNFRAKARLKFICGYALDAASPSGLAVSKDGLWVADWNKGLMLMDNKDLSTLKVFNGAGGGGPFRPAALAAAVDGLWALDMAQLRFVKKDFKDGAALESVKTPCPAPQALAWDGYNLWSFDAASGLLYRYCLDPKAGVSAGFEIPGLKNLLSMQWRGSELWTLDSRSILTRRSFKDGAFSLISSQKLKNPALAFWAEGADFWTVEKAGTLGGYELRKYALKTY